MSVTYVSDDRH